MIYRIQELTYPGYEEFIRATYYVQKRVWWLFWVSVKDAAGDPQVFPSRQDAERWIDLHG